MKAKFISGFASILVLSFIAACGNDSSSSTNAETSYEESSSSAERTSVKTVYELGECSSKNKNETLYVSEEGEDYTCSNKNGNYTWVSAVKSSSSSVIDQTVYSK